MKSLSLWIAGLFVVFIIFSDDTQSDIASGTQSTAAAKPALKLTEVTEVSTQRPAKITHQNAKPKTQSTAKVDYVFVTGSRVNIRSAPSVQGQKLGSFAYGTRLELLETGNGWNLVSADKGGTAIKGWMSAKYLSASTQNTTRAPQAAPATRSIAAPTSAEISRAKSEIIRNSIRAYPGSCPCPYNRDSAGRRCGKRSAWSRPGGYSPMCYESDISSARLETYFARRR